MRSNNKAFYLPCLLTLTFALGACQKSEHPHHEHSDIDAEYSEQQAMPHQDDHSHIEHGDEHGTHHDEPHTHDTHHDHDHDHDHHHDHDHSAMNMTQYSCVPDMTIYAHYDQSLSDDKASSAHLLIEDIEYDFNLVQAKTSTDEKVTNETVTYESEFGINDNGMRWIVTGDSARLVDLVSPAQAPAEDTPVLYQCDKAAS